MNLSNIIHEITYKNQVIQILSNTFENLYF